MKIIKINYLDFREKTQNYIVKFLSNTKKVVLFFLIIILIVGAIYFQLQKEKVLKSKIGEKAEEKVQIIPSTVAFFNTTVEPIRVRTQVTIQYRQPAIKSMIWFGFFPEKGENKKLILMDHHVLENLDWKEVNNIDYTLFQKEMNYNSVDEFLEKPPMDKLIAVDPSIIEYGVLKGVNIVRIDEFLNLDNIDYILTTYHRSYEENGWTVFKTLLDTSKAKIEDGKMIWFLEMEKITPENPLEMKGVEVDFKQPANIINK